MLASCTAGCSCLTAAALHARVMARIVMDALGVQALQLSVLLAQASEAATELARCHRPSRSSVLHPNTDDAGEQPKLVYKHTQHQSAELCSLA